MRVLAVEREKNFSFVVLEWLEGFPLVDLLRARRALTLREMLMLLKQVAPAVDAAREANLMLEMNLRNILVHFPESFAEPAANVVLRCPLDEWPAFVVKMSLLAKVKELEASARSVEEQTIVSDAKPQRDVVQLGILAYELLGGKRGGFAPLANVSEEGNEILRKCLTPDRSFSSARDFCEALGSIATAKSVSIAPSPAPPEPDRSTSPRLKPSPETLGQRAPTESAPLSSPLPRSKNNVLLLVAALTAILLAAGLVWFLGPTFLNPTSAVSSRNAFAKAERPLFFGLHPSRASHGQTALTCDSCRSATFTSLRGRPVCVISRRSCRRLAMTPLVVWRLPSPKTDSSSTR